MPKEIVKLIPIKIKLNFFWDCLFDVILKQKMFGLFKKKTQEEKLQEQYQKLLKESFELSKSNRAASDKKQVEAQAVLDQIEALKK